MVKKSYYLLFLSIGMLSACQKYVDIKKSSAQSFLETANDCQLLMDNYTLFNQGYLSDGEISADDYYLTPSYYNSSAISVEERSLYTWNKAAIRQDPGMWTNLYNKVYNANLVLETLAKLGGKAPQATLDNLKGSALLLRAFSHWNVAQLYAAPYDENAGTSPGIPIHNSSDINDVPGRGTVTATYKAITDDLELSASLLGDHASIASRPSKGAAYALLSRVYLSMRDYPNALTAATSALQLNSTLIDYNTLDAGVLTPFKRFNDEVIFQAVHSTSALLEPGYGDDNYCVIDSSLFASYDANDLRQSIFFKENSDPETGDFTGTFHFSGNYDPTVSSAQFCGLATDELYLNRAECYARAGNTTAALSDLNTLLRTRWKTGTFTDITASDASQALTIILKERRKELVMRAMRWTDLRRLNQEATFKTTLTRNVTIDNTTTTYTLPPGDARYVLLIPQEVITNSKLSQNAR